jgi:hypothetical protein
MRDNRAVSRDASVLASTIEFTVLAELRRCHVTRFYSVAEENADGN